ncbi:M28 family peptidase [Paenibacillus hemerocallicola]|uniref:M28 family peptidase n=1 Tax=Paenibacillus hemerocallicola TaxID=1172614 RepID=A0A5C4T0M2_9BACL|nr:M20/M25/M40 family metallo-hydrolase [Paenibacillus hemerocallicola]TNJ62601.1 M28 family peptidase [Paenibacillus hemerocallicola]
MHRIAAMSLIIIVLATGIWLGIQPLKPPSPPSESDADYPAYHQMMANLKAMTLAPHPSGSEELASVRAYLLAQIRAMGLEATIEKVRYTVADVEADILERNGAPKFNNNHVGEPPPADAFKDTIRRRAHFDENDEVVLQNILVKLDAPGTDRGILLSAHYDTKPTTPGAADDMISVSAMLEAMREQADKANLRSDLYFLFTDGEELGALGAKAFVQSHPELLDTIDLVVNFEARGNRGGLLMFETSDDNLDAVRYFQSASSRPLAYSFTTALYRRMPNGTDLTHYLKAGYTGLNFAAAEGVEHYHRLSDSFENLDRGTAYHFLQTVMEMANHAASEPFQDSRRQDSLYFPLFPGHLAVMSRAASYALSAAAALFAVWWMIVQIRTDKVRLRMIFVEAGWLLGGVVGAALFSWGIVFGLTRLMQLDESTNNDTVFLSVILALGACVLAAGSLLVRKLSLRQAIAGLVPLLLLLIVGSAALFQDISYLFSFATLGILVVALLDRYRIGRWIATAVVGAGIGFLYAPVCWLIYVLFMLPFAPVVAAISVIPISMAAALLATTSKDASGPNRSAALFTSS